MFKRKMAAAFAAASMVMAVPATAQLTQQGGLVNVTITDVSILNNFLNDTQIAALNNLSVPVVVQVPIGIAANVCNTTVAVLSAAGSGGACTATSGSQALAQVVNRQMLRQRK
jgi:hypothetical protein